MKKQPTTAQAIRYSDSVMIENTHSGEWKLTDTDEQLLLVEHSKPTFNNYQTGEQVLEFTGMATDKNKDRSWAKATFTAGAHSPLHYHNEREEWYYIIKGTAKVTLDGVEHILNTGDFVKIQRKQKHQVFNAGTEPMEMMVKCAPAWVLSDQHEIV